MGKMQGLLTFVLATALSFAPIPGEPLQSQAQSSLVQLNSPAGVCPNWSLDGAASGFNGVKWSRSGSRNIVLEWTLSSTNLEGTPVSRRFTPDEADQIRAAFHWWDSVFDTVEFREVSGDYAQIKVGAMSRVFVTDSTYWYFQKSMTFARAQISMPAASNEAVYFDGVSYNESTVRAALGYLLGLKSNTAPDAVAQSKLRRLYGENNCYPAVLDASWDTSKGLPSKNPMAAIGSAQKVNLDYGGYAQVGVRVLTPSTCIASNSSVAAKSGLVVKITGQGVCSVMVRAREGTLPFNSEVLTLRTGFSQKIITTGVPKTLKIGKPFTLKAVTNSGIPVSLTSETASICRVVGKKVIGAKPGSCHIRVSANGATLGPMRFLPQSQAVSLTILK